jgi:hypothetical protein
VTRGNRAAAGSAPRNAPAVGERKFLDIGFAGDPAKGILWNDKHGVSAHSRYLPALRTVAASNPSYASQNTKIDLAAKATPAAFIHLNILLLVMTLTHKISILSDYGHVTEMRSHRMRTELHQMHRIAPRYRI